MNELDRAQVAYSEACNNALRADYEVDKTKRNLLTIELREVYGVEIGDSIEWIEPGHTNLSWERPAVVIPAKIYRGKLLSYEGGAITVLVYRKDCKLSSREKRVWITGRPELNIKKIAEPKVRI
jgi:hypothetical protein